MSPIFLDMLSAAQFYGCSTRQFHRIVIQEKIKIHRFPYKHGKKDFVLFVDVEELKRTKPFKHQRGVYAGSYT